MHRILLLPMTLIFAISLNAQDTDQPLLKKNYVSLSLEDVLNDRDGFNPDFEVRYGRYLDNHWLVGISSSVRRSDRFDRQSFGLFTRYYLGKKQKGLFLESSYRFGLSEQRVLDLFNNNRLDAISSRFQEAYMGAGMTLMNKKNFGVELYGGYRFTRTNGYDFDTNRSVITNTSGIEAGIRLQYQF